MTGSGDFDNLLSTAEQAMKSFQDEYVFSQARFPAFVAAIATGKTMCAILRMMRLMEESPNNLGIIVRKEFTDLSDSTVKDFYRYTGLTLSSHKEVKLQNGSVILFRHGSEIETLKNGRGSTCFK